MLPAVLLLVALVYLPVLQNEFISFDDDKYITENPDILKLNSEGVKQAFTTPYVGNWAPVQMLVYMLVAAVFKLNPVAFHLVNLFFHLVNTYLVYLLIKRLSRYAFTPLLVAMFFGIHPLHVESVVWAAELKDVLYTCFYLLSLLAYMKSRTDVKPWRQYTLSLFFFIVSLMSKSAAVTLPVLLVLLDIYQGRKQNLHSVFEKVPFFVLSLIFGILTLRTQGVMDAGGAMPHSYSIVERIFMFTYAIAFYIIQIIVPVKMSVVHPYPDVNAGLLPWEYYASLPFILMLAGLLIKKFAFRRGILFGILFFLITISVMLQIIPTGHAIVAERYTYVASIGLFFITGQWILQMADARHRRIGMIAAVFVALVFSFITWGRVGVWRNNSTLYSDLINKYPGHYFGYLKRGDHKSDNGDYAGAIKDYDQAIALNPGHYRAYNNRGNAFIFIGDQRAALEDFDKCLELDTQAVSVYFNRAQLKKNLGDNEGALKDINRGIELSPDHADAWLIRGKIRSNLNDHQGAVADYSESINLNGTISQTYFYRGLSYFSLLDSSQACRDWEKALSMGYRGAQPKLDQYCR